MSVPDDERFLRWFYDAESLPTDLWKGLHEIAHRELAGAAPADEVVDDVIMDLLRRLEMDPSSLAPLPALSGLVEDERDYLDVRRYCGAAVRNKARKLGNDEPPTVSEEYWAVLQDEAITEPWPSKPYGLDPTAGSALDMVASAAGMDGWIAALKEVRNVLVMRPDLTRPEERPAILGFLEHLLGAVDIGGGWPQLLASYDGADFLTLARRAGASLMPAGRQDRRTFMTAFHHAFWRACGEIVHGDGFKLEVPDAFEHLAEFTRVDVFAFMREHHDGMMGNNPGGFAFRSQRSPVAKNRVFIELGRSAWWDSLVRSEVAGAVTWPPPTPYRLPGSEA